MKPWNAHRDSAQGTVHLTYGKTDMYSIFILCFTFVDSNVVALSKAGGPLNTFDLEHRFADLC